MNLIFVSPPEVTHNPDSPVMMIHKKRPPHLPLLNLGPLKNPNRALYSRIAVIGYEIVDPAKDNMPPGSAYQTSVK